MRFLRFLLVLVMLPCAAFAADEAKLGARHLIKIDKLEREYYLYKPANMGNDARPLVVVLHGGAGKPAGAARMTGFSELADQENFMVAYPAGAGRVPTWNAGKCCGYAERRNIDDVGFIRAMVEEIRKNNAVDPLRIYATGMSNGAMMAYRLGCEMSDVFSVVAPVSGAMNVYTCVPTQRPSLVVFNALDDKHVLYQGGVSETGLRRLFGQAPERDSSVADAMNFWMKQNLCRKFPQIERYDDYSISNYFCAEDREVRLFTLNKGGHSWPGGKKGYEGADEPYADLSATREMWKFFMRHPPRPLF